MNLFQLLPLLDGWENLTDRLEAGLVLQPGGSLKIVDTQHPGWIIGGTGVTDNPYLGLQFDYDRIISTTSAYGIRRVGAATPLNVGPWVGVYDDVLGIYTVNYTPSQPRPFKGYLRISFVNPVTTDIRTPNVAATCLGVQFNYTEITDMNAFKASLKEVQDTPNIIKALEELKQIEKLAPV